VLSARIDRATVRLPAAVGWILTGEFGIPTGSSAPSFDRGHAPATPTPNACPSAEVLQAQESLLVALRDDDVRATGRLSRTPAAPCYAAQCGRAWAMHSRCYTRITSDQWTEGTYDWAKDSLDLPGGQFIDVQVPRWMIEAFWPPNPKPPPEVGVAEIADAAYTTPYLELMQQAIAELGISAANQPKKDTVMEWFRQKAGGASLSENHIRHLATFVRLPHSQKGGNRKWSAASAERP